MVWTNRKYIAGCQSSGHKIKPGYGDTFLYDIVSDDNGDETLVDEEGNITVRTAGTKPNGIFTEYWRPCKRMMFKHDLYYTGDKAYKPMLMATSGLSAGMMTLLNFRLPRWPFEVGKYFIGT